MISLQSIFDKHGLSPAAIDRLKQEARASALDCGKSTRHKVELDPETWNLFSLLADEVWEFDKSASNAEKIEVGFQLYELFPHYYHFLVPFYHLIREKALTSQELKDIIWSKFMEYLGGEQYYADPVGYVLWVDFFEDETTVQETWQGLMNYSKNKKALLKMLDCIGPVPFHLKEGVYLKLIKDEKNHERIFNSLFNSAHDLYGQVDNRRANMLLSKLRLDPRSESYQHLKRRLGKDKPLNPFK